MWQQSMPWPMLLMFALLWLYGLWPVLRPEHFRQTCVQCTRPRFLEAYAASEGLIRVLATIWLILTGVAIASGVYSRF